MKQTKTKKASFLRNNWDLITLGSFIVIYSAVFITLSILRYSAYATNFDLANMSQTVWNTLHSRPFALSGAEGTISRFSIHADLILVFLTPFYMLWEKTRMLLIIQSVALGLGALPVFFLTKKALARFKDLNPNVIKIAALSIALVYLLNPVMEWTNIYDFHGVAFAIPFLLAAFFFAYTEHWRWFWLFTFLSLTTKEEISLVVATLGIAIFFIFRQKLIGLITFFAGILWFSVMVFIVMPYFSPDGVHWSLNDLYTPALQKISESHSIPAAWDVFRGYFLIPQAFDYYQAMLKPFAFVPILGLPWLLIAIPEFAVNLLSTNHQMQNTTLHYGSGIIPFLVIATIFGIKYIMLLWVCSKALNPFRNTFLLVVSIFLVIVAFRVNYHYSPLPTTPSCWCLSYQVTQEDRDFNKALKLIPKNASVTASSEIRAHLAQRENAYNLPGGVDKAEYVAILNQSRIVGDYSLKDFEVALTKKLLVDPSYQLLYKSEHFYLFKKK